MVLQIQGLRALQVDSESHLILRQQVFLIVQPLQLFQRGYSTGMSCLLKVSAPRCQSLAGEFGCQLLTALSSNQDDLQMLKAYCNMFPRYNEGADEGCHSLCGNATCRFAAWQNRTHIKSQQDPYMTPDCASSELGWKEWHDQVIRDRC